MSNFNNVFPVCVQLSLGQNLANTSNLKDGNFTWYAPFNMSLAPRFIDNNGNDLYYSITDIKPGFWIATNGGLAWRIYDVVYTGGSSVQFYLEDVNNYCINLDSTGGNGIPQSGGLFLAFEVNEEGQPLIFPIEVFDDSIRNVPVGMINRFAMFNVAKQYVAVYQINHGLSIGDPIWCDPSDGKYKKANNANAKYIIGIVSIVSTQGPYSTTSTIDNFNYKAYGTYYYDLQYSFPSLDFSSYSTGQFLYLSTDPTQKIQRIKSF
jgi:hypothetical protein